jgi:hypothetical protein
MMQIHAPRTALRVLLSMAMAAIPHSAAATSPQNQVAGTTTPSDPAALAYATRGVVQAIDAHMIVIARPRGRGTITFNVTPLTRREGVIVVGSAVSVRYREDNGNRVATAVVLHQTGLPRPAS